MRTLFFVCIFTCRLPLFARFFQFAPHAPLVLGPVGQGAQPPVYASPFTIEPKNADVTHQPVKIPSFRFFDHPLNHGVQSHGY